MDEIIIFLIIFLFLNRKKDEVIKTSDITNEKIGKIQNVSEKTISDIKSFVKQNQVQASKLKEKFEEEKKNLNNENKQLINKPVEINKIQVSEIKNIETNKTERIVNNIINPTTIERKNIIDLNKRLETPVRSNQVISSQNKQLSTRTSSTQTQIKSIRKI